MAKKSEGIQRSKTSRLFDARYIQRSRNARPNSIIYLVAKRVPTDNDRLRPARNNAGDVVYQQGLAKDGAAEYVPDRPVRRFVHLVQFKFLHAFFVRGNRGALDAHVVLLDGLGGVHRYLVTGLNAKTAKIVSSAEATGPNRTLSRAHRQTDLVAVLDAEIIVFGVNFDVRKDQL
ncbi:MAG: hypothetical protein BJ554DRAFT_7250 [Olpidium bornovanus]|uniref:Uncharacterized protein n=1 Tax=Olpidium bornovanus TaxID=278681 RepID=A0A8H7ZWR8_9FUNG|nr:MAG: hypothetical protein BJ554DRAFT_7250 [Olpidium bornovanus]